MVMKYKLKFGTRQEINSIEELYAGINIIYISHFRNAVGALVVYDVTKGSTFESVLEWVENLK